LKDEKNKVIVKNMKKRVAFLFGGRSGEHQISLMSTKEVVNALDKEKFEPFLIGISKKGKWYKLEEIPLEEVKEEGNPLEIIPGGERHFLKDSPPIDVVFPLLHGPYGEDGTLQGLLDMMEIPYVGSRVGGSAISMDKDLSKRLLKEKGIKTAKFLTFKKRPSFSQIEKELGTPFFLKPARMGSSLGVSKIKDKEDFEKGVKEAFLYDEKILAEEFIEGRELECSVLGKDNPIASSVGEIIPNLDFYCYKSKYFDKKGAKLIIPVSLEKEIEEKIKSLAIDSFLFLECQGMARVDFFLRDKEVLVNELNTIPGFTKISMYPKLWQESGISYKDLITKLIELAI